MSYSEGNSYEEILVRCLSDPRLTNIDKRVGSIIYDSLAPLCLELAEAYVKMDIMETQTYLGTATGSNLDKRVYDYGIFRREATKAEVEGIFKKYLVDSNGQYIIVDGEKVLVDMDVPIGSRFAIPTNPNVTYIFKEKRIINDSLKNVLECEVSGGIGSSYSGVIFPITPILDLVSAQIGGIISTGQDQETDDQLRERAQDELNNVSFGGNIADYIEKVGEINGVGSVKVFPAYANENQAVISVKAENGAPITSIMLTAIQSAILGVTGVERADKLQFDGGVRIWVVNDDFNPLSPEELATIQNEIDPVDSSGLGYGIAPIGHVVNIVTPTEETLTVILDVEIDNSSLQVETPKVKASIINYIKSVRSSFKQDNVLRVYASEIIRLVKNDCPNIKDVRNVKLNGQSVNYVEYADTIYEQEIPLVTNEDITVNEAE